MMLSFVAEMLAVWFFVLIILRVACCKANAGNHAGGLVIGLGLFLAVSLSANVSGGGLNPAVVTGLWVYNLIAKSAVQPGQLGHHFVAYWLGTIIGALLALGTHAFLECGEDDENE